MATSDFEAKIGGGVVQLNTCLRRSASDTWSSEAPFRTNDEPTRPSPLRADAYAPPGQDKPLKHALILF